VADCPAGTYSQSFNPRLILLRAILGFEDDLIRPDSVIWDCTNCYTCSERCPQDVRPVDVIIALKNLCVQQGQAPPLVEKITDAVLESGMTTQKTSSVARRRQELDLPPLRDCPVDELKKILDDD
jgi:heterodisulfide reductase subunit C